MDRVGIGWRGELAADIFSHLDKIDILEVIADSYFSASNRELNSLKTLSSYLPLSFHGVSMGLATASPIHTKRLEKMARMVDKIQPESWSEHLAFVRVGDIEIGHLAAPPRTEENIESSIKNIQLAEHVIGSKPSLENIATLITPPASHMDEATWVTAIIEETGCSLLLDLHNLYANAKNFNENPAALLNKFPLDRISTIHISGGKWISEPANNSPAKMRLLDDHLHDVPVDIYSLLTEVAKKTNQPLSIILERDGNYPAFSVLLAQLELARDALKKGRQCRQQN